MLTLTHYKENTSAPNFLYLFRSDFILFDLDRIKKKERKKTKRRKQKKMSSGQELLPCGDGLSVVSLSVTEPQFIIVMVHIAIIGIFYSGFCVRTTLDKEALESRLINVNMAVFFGLFCNLTLYLSHMAGFMDCWYTLSMVMIAPPMTVTPYFLMSFEYWGKEKKNKMRWLPLRLLSKIVPPRFSTLRVTSTIFVFMMLYIIVACVTLKFRYENIGSLQFFNGDCSLGNEVWVLVCIFAFNIILGLFCFYLQYDSGNGKDWAAIKASKLFLLEQNLVFFVSLLMVTAYFALFFSEELYKKAIESGLTSPTVFLFFSNMSPILISGVFDQLLSFWNMRKIIVQRVSAPIVAELAKRKNRRSGIGRRSYVVNNTGDGMIPLSVNQDEEWVNGYEMKPSNTNDLFDESGDDDDDIDIDLTDRKASPYKKNSKDGHERREKHHNIVFFGPPDIEKMTWFAMTRDMVVELECLEQSKTMRDISGKACKYSPLISAKIMLQELYRLEEERNDHRVHEIINSDDFRSHTGKLKTSMTYEEKIDFLIQHAQRLWATRFMEIKESK